MKILALISICLAVSLLPAQNNLIFGGGQDDGYTEHSFSQDHNNPIFGGGDDDGYSATAISQRANNEIFGGGDDDGYTVHAFSQDLNNRIFGGGDDDGYTDDHFAQLDNNPIFGGGIDDGYTQQGYSQMDNNPIFMGGDDDGYICFYLETATPVRLPPILTVDWLSFEAFAVDSKVRLQWETAREVNHQFFQVERSVDLINVEEVGQEVASQGNAEEGSQYLAWDVSPLGGSSFYRIQAVDNNGELSYTEWREVRFSSQHAISFTAFPNPVKHSLTATFQSPETLELDLRLTDLQGRILWSLQRTVSIGETKISVPVEGLTEGLYFLEASTEKGISKTIRILKQH